MKGNTCFITEDKHLFVRSAIKLDIEVEADEVPPFQFNLITCATTVCPQKDTLNVMHVSLYSTIWGLRFIIFTVMLLQLYFFVLFYCLTCMMFRAM